MRARRAAALLASALLTAGAGRLPGADGTVPGPPDSRVVREARYRMSAGVRPLLFFWIRAANVGGARILWREGEDGRRGYELLIGSDPRRAPRRINRWGWEREDVGPEGATLVGLMRKTDEESFEEARSEVDRDGRGGYVYKSIRSQVAGGEARVENTVLRVPRDYTYRDLAELQSLFSAPERSPASRRVATLPQGTFPGFLFAVSDLIDQAVDAALAPRPGRRLLEGAGTTFTFNASLYDLRLRSTDWLETATYGGRKYERLVRMNLEHVNRDKKTRERFVLVCPTEGPLARVPVFIEYQPKWWFRAQGVLDDSEAFP